MKSVIDGRVIEEDECLIWHTVWDTARSPTPSVERHGEQQACRRCGRQCMEAFRLPLLGTMLTGKQTGGLFCLGCTQELIANQHGERRDDADYCPQCGFPWVGTGHSLYTCIFHHRWKITTTRHAVLVKDEAEETVDVFEEG